MVLESSCISTSEIKEMDSMLRQHGKRGGLIYMNGQGRLGVSLDDHRDWRFCEIRRNHSMVITASQNN